MKFRNGEYGKEFALQRFRDFFAKLHMADISAYILLIAAAAAVVVALLPAVSPYSSTSGAVVSKQYSQTALLKQTGSEAASHDMSDRIDNSKTDGRTDPSKTEALKADSPKQFVRNGSETVNILIENYCDALKEGNEEMLAKYTDSTADIDGTYKSIFARYVEDVTDINCYTMNGMLNNTYIVFVTYNVRYYGYSTIIPATMYCYVCTDASGNLYVSNKEPGDDVSSYNEMMYKSTQITDIVAKVAEEHDRKLDEDKELAAFVAGFSQE